jgi:hypothetical protein
MGELRWGLTSPPVAAGFRRKLPDASGSGNAKSPDFTGLFVVGAQGIEPGPCEGRAAH